MFSGHSLALGLARLLFLQVEVQRCFAQAYLNAVEVKEFLAVLAERDVVFARDDAQREVLALVVGLKLVGVAGFGPRPLHFGLGDRFPFQIFASSLYGARGLRQRESSGQPHGEREQQGKDEIFPHDWPPGIASEFTELDLLNLIPAFRSSRTREAHPWQRKRGNRYCPFTNVLAQSGGGFRIRNGIFRARFVKRAQAEHTTAADTAAAIFALIA